MMPLQLDAFLFDTFHSLEYDSVCMFGYLCMFGYVCMAVHGYVCMAML